MKSQIIKRLRKETKEKLKTKGFGVAKSSSEKIPKKGRKSKEEQIRSEDRED